MQYIWTAFLPTLTFVALVSAIQIELGNTDKHDWHWITKHSTGVKGVSLKILTFSMMSFFVIIWIIG